MGTIQQWIEKIREFLTGQWEPRESEDGSLITRQKILAFTIALIFSFSLWFIVNMGRDYSITIMLPVQVTNLPGDIALSNEIPERAAVSVSGEGWNLFNVYTNPPTITLNVENQQVNLFEQVRQQISSMNDLNVMQVEPMLVDIETEQKVTKKVPVESRIELTTRDQFGVLGTPEFQPDSVTISGAASKIAEIEAWNTQPTSINDVYRDLELNIELEEPESSISLNPASVTFRADIAEFTEAEVRVPVRSRNLPAGKAITFSPSSILVKFDVPIHQYNEVQNVQPFMAYVDYERVENDTTGLITPQLERITEEFDVRMRSFQPTRVSYFNIIPQ